MNECLFCNGKLRIDSSSAKLTQKGGVLRAYCDNCGIVFRIGIHGQYRKKKSVISTDGEPGERYKADFNLVKGFETKTRV